jgi:hypothetical protein
VGHLLARIALAGGGVRGHRALDGGEVVGTEGQLERAERLRQLVARARPDQRHDVVPLREHPRDGDLGGRRAVIVGDRSQRVDEREVALHVAGLEARRAAAEVARRERAIA